MGKLTLLAQLAYLADELVYLIGLGIALMHRFLVQRADDALKEVAELRAARGDRTAGRCRRR